MDHQWLRNGCEKHHRTRARWTIHVPLLGQKDDFGKVGRVYPKDLEVKLLCFSRFGLFCLTSSAHLTSLTVPHNHKQPTTFPRTPKTPIQRVLCKKGSPLKTSTYLSSPKETDLSLRLCRGDPDPTQLPARVSTTHQVNYHSLPMSHRVPSSFDGTDANDEEYVYGDFDQWIRLTLQ